MMCYHLTRFFMMPYLSAACTQSVLPLNLVPRSMALLIIIWKGIHPFTKKVLHMKHLSSRTLYNHLTKTTESWTPLKFLENLVPLTYLPTLSVQNFNQGSPRTQTERRMV